MAVHDSLKSLVRQYIKTNGQNEITGQILQNVLIAMIDELGITIDPTPTKNSSDAVSSGGTFGALQQLNEINATLSGDGKIYNNYQAGDIYYTEQNSVRVYWVALADGEASEENPVTISDLNFYHAENATDAVRMSLSTKTFNIDAYTKQESDAKYQPKGNYQPAGDYATEQQLAGKANASDVYTKQESDAKYQPKGNYQPAGDYATEQQLAGKANASDVYTKSETYSKAELDNLITTPNQQYVSVTATAQTTAITDLLPATGAADTIYRVGNWDGTQYDPTMYALFAWNGTTYVCLAVRSFVGEVYDVSVNHPDGQGNPTPYADLTAALGSNGVNIPADIRRGGMSIKFIQGNAQSSDNKYVQFRLMCNAFTTVESYWQGIDTNPNKESHNLVESGGVYNDAVLPIIKIKGVLNPDVAQPSEGEYYIHSSNGVLCQIKNGNRTIHSFKTNAKYNMYGRIFFYDENDETTYKIKDSLKVIEIKAISDQSTAVAAMSADGEYYINVSNKKLFLILNRTQNPVVWKEIPFEKDVIYTYNSKNYVYDGQNLIDVTDNVFSKQEVSYTKGTINSSTGAIVGSNKAIVTNIIAQKPVYIKTGDNLYLKYIFEYDLLGNYIGLLLGPVNRGEYIYKGKHCVRAVFERLDGADISLDDANELTIVNGVSDNIDNASSKMFSPQNVSFSIGTVNSATGADTYSPTALRSVLIISHPAYIRTGDKLYIRYIFEWKPDGTYIGSLLGGPSFLKEYFYAGTNNIKIVCERTDGANVSVSDADELTIVNGLGYCIDNARAPKGRKLIVLGDSIPEGAVADGRAPAMPYPNIVAQTLNMSLVNYAIGGSTFAQKDNFGGTFNSYDDFVAAEKDTTKIYCVLTGNQSYQNYKYEDGNWVVMPASEGYTRTPISSRYQYMEDGDVVLVHCSTNDFQYNWTAIGTMADRTPATFYGAVHYTILGLLQKYLGKTIVFCTPIKRAQSPYTNQTSVNDFGKTLSDYADIVKEVCKYYSVPVIDLYSESLLNPELSIQSSLFDSIGTHPLQQGHIMMARIVSGKLRSIIG